MKSKDALIFVKLNGYYVDHIGNVFHESTLLKSYTGKTGYVYFRISHLNKFVPVHRLIGYQKFGELIFEKGMLIRHLDGNPSNNSIDNIDIGTQSDNMMDIPKEIRQNNAKNANKKYSDEFIEELRMERNNGLTYKQLGEKFNMCKSMLSYYLGKDNRVRKEVIL